MITIELIVTLLSINFEPVFTLKSEGILFETLIVKFLNSTTAELPISINAFVLIFSYSGFSPSITMSSVKTHGDSTSFASTKKEI